MNIVPKLNLNRFFKDNDNLSLVDANNMMLSEVPSCLTNEYTYYENSIIRLAINDTYSKEINIDKISVIHILPTPNELVIFVLVNDTYIDLFRFNEKKEICKKVFTKLPYNGGELKSTYMYNSENSLIIAISEYNIEELIPLKTINLGNFDDDTIYNDRDIDVRKLSMCPEVKIPSISNLNYIPGNTYKGWHYLFIRFKINKNDYTQWFNIGYPIYCDNIIEQNIIKYCFSIQDDGVSNTYCAGCSSSFSDDLEICNLTYKTKINFNIKDTDVDYNIYQIGVICTNKTTSKAFKTNDIVKNNNEELFIFNINILEEYDINNLTTSYYNYFNIKNLITYNNRLYISNYKENINQDIQSILDRIILNVKKVPNTINDMFYDYAMNSLEIADGSQYYSNEFGKIPLYKFLNIDENTIISISYPSDSGTAYDTNKANYYYLYIESGETLEPIIAPINAKGKIKIYIGEVNSDNTTNTILLDVDLSKYKLQSLALLFTDVKNSFIDRLNQHTLLPNEVYNFFIHFVDKYGCSTDGYRLNNNTKFERNISDTWYPCYYSIEKYNNKTYYVTFDENATVCSDMQDRYEFTGNIRIYTDINDDLKDSHIYRFINEVDDEIDRNEIIKLFEAKYNNLYNEKFTDTYMYQIVNNDILSINTFDAYINSNGDRLFKTPNIDDTSLLYLDVNNIELPEGYIGYYFSYEKMEKINITKGVLTRNDFRSKDKEGSEVRLTANDIKNKKCYFYTDEYDILDTIKLDYKLIKIVTSGYGSDTGNQEFGYIRSEWFKYPHINNYLQKRNNIINKFYSIDDYKLCVAGSSEDNRIGKGTALELNEIGELFPVFDSTTVNNKIKIYAAIICNPILNIYTSKNKQLIKFTDVYYPDNKISNVTNITKGYNGRYTYGECLIYENSGVSFNTTDFTVRRLEKNNLFYSSDKQTTNAFIGYMQTLFTDDYFHESKCFNNKPENVIYPVEEDKTFAAGCFVTPENSIDLFKNNQTNQDELFPKYYTNYDSEKLNIIDYNETLRRSNVIQDESRENAWRQFPVEGYKNIAKNKGIITNIVGVGSVFLIHTEHSLFMLNTANMLQTLNEDVQLAQQDAFDVDYQEVFTSDLGFGGLQDNKAWVLDQFGYIFYDNNFNRFYRFDSNNKLEIIDVDILRYLRSFKPISVRFANDKYSDRLLIKLTNKETSKIISYNYLIGNFISFHDYTFDEAYNTKTNLYLVKNNRQLAINIDKEIYEFKHDSYGNGDNECTISIIINEEYQFIKFLEYITYKLRKTKSDDFTINITLYSGNEIRINNDIVDTDYFDISIDTETNKNKLANYKKPFWQLNNWNLSYLRNKDKDKSRLYGNYFIVNFKFKNDSDGNRIEFEELNYQLNYSRI